MLPQSTMADLLMSGVEPRGYEPPAETGPLANPPLTPPLMAPAPVAPRISLPTISPGSPYIREPGEQRPAGRALDAMAAPLMPPAKPQEAPELFRPTMATPDQSIGDLVGQAGMQVMQPINRSIRGVDASMGNAQKQYMDELGKMYGEKQRLLGIKQKAEEATALELQDRQRQFEERRKPIQERFDMLADKLMESINNPPKENPLRGYLSTLGVALGAAGAALARTPNFALQALEQRTRKASQDLANNRQALGNALGLTKEQVGALEGEFKTKDELADGIKGALDRMVSIGLDKASLESPDMVKAAMQMAAADRARASEMEVNKIAMKRAMDFNEDMMREQMRDDRARRREAGVAPQLIGNPEGWQALSNEQRKDVNAYVPSAKSMLTQLDDIAKVVDEAGAGRLAPSQARSSLKEMYRIYKGNARNYFGTGAALTRFEEEMITPPNMLTPDFFGDAKRRIKVMRRLLAKDIKSRIGAYDLELAPEYQSYLNE